MLIKTFFFIYFFPYGRSTLLLFIIHINNSADLEHSFDNTVTISCAKKPLGSQVLRSDIKIFCSTFTNKSIGPVITVHTT